MTDSRSLDILRLASVGSGDVDEFTEARVAWVVALVESVLPRMNILMIFFRGGALGCRHPCSGQVCTGL